MVFFEINQNNKLQIHPEALTVKIFKEIWDRDKDKSKANAINDFIYVYYSTHYKSPYRNIKEPERTELIIKDCISNLSYSPDNKVKEAVDIHIKLIESSSQAMGLLRDAESAVEKIREYFRTVDLKETDDNGKLKYTAKDLQTNLKAIGELFQSLKILREQVERDEEESSNIRGGGTKGIFEDFEPK